MSITPVAPSAPAGTSEPMRAPKQSMDSEVFLHLLVTQLANQDPSTPMDTNQMISQTAQLSSMERLNTLAEAQRSSLDIQQRTAAAALIGQHVTSAGEPPMRGIVTAVSFTAQGPVLSVGQQKLALEQVAKVTPATVGAVPANPANPDPADPVNPEPAA
ncbi:flagellar hook assembly protein FlgD [Glutamicibacter sp. MCAF14]|uniref:flagellar hook assembly protein FlgD n=1 Tax=Glutamicibacter sp. MCAF14 TaxID=3233043 RepID=UPI003F913B3A